MKIKGKFSSVYRFNNFLFFDIMSREKIVLIIKLDKLSYALNRIEK